MLISYFYSDPHFGHGNIIEFANRPFSSLKEMEEALIKNYNEMVKPNQTVLWCGDCSFRLSELPTILGRLNGRKILVRGNHDDTAPKMAQMGFDLVLESAVLTIAGKTCRVSHYPYAGTLHLKGGVDPRYLKNRPKRVPGEVLIHGHTHSPRKLYRNMVHVGVDAWQYRPAAYDEVEDLVLKAWSVSSAPGT